jgi:hypothetical protein
MVPRIRSWALQIILSSSSLLDSITSSISRSCLREAFGVRTYLDTLALTGWPVNNPLVNIPLVTPNPSYICTIRDSKFCNVLALNWRASGFVGSISDSPKHVTFCCGFDAREYYKMAASVHWNMTRAM